MIWHSYFDHSGKHCRVAFLNIFMALLVGRHAVLGIRSSAPVDGCNHDDGTRYCGIGIVSHLEKAD